MQKELKKRLWFSALFSGIMTGISGLVGKNCTLAEPGGITNGWHGLPIPYYWCGVWGNTCGDLWRCVKGLSEGCFSSSAIAILIFLADLAIWFAISYLVIHFLWKKIPKKS